MMILAKKNQLGVGLRTAYCFFLLLNLLFPVFVNSIGCHGNPPKSTDLSGRSIQEYLTKLLEQERDTHANKLIHRDMKTNI